MFHTEDEYTAAHEQEVCMELWAAVLLRAVEDIQYGSARGWQSVERKPKYSTENQKAYFTARDWLQSESRAPTSFRWVCGVCHLDPDIVRKQITTRKEST